jgi:cytochrome c oxidase subunit IV
MAKPTGPTSPHDPADYGHHGHHILPPKVLLRTFGALVGLTALTVLVAFMERGGVVHFGEAGSIAVALLIAGAKATIVAMFFMALKYDNRVNALAFVMGVVFLVVFFVFTFLDTGFRGQFEGVPDARFLDKIEMERRALERMGAEIPLAPPMAPEVGGAVDGAAEVDAP